MSKEAKDKLDKEKKAEEAAESTESCEEKTCDGQDNGTCAAEKMSETDPCAELEKELTAAKDLLLRTAAEYDNYRKRTEKEKQGSVSFGTATAIEKLLPALDALELAAFSETTDVNYKKGVELTLSMFKTALTGLGVEEIEAVKKPFDPQYHAAIAQVDSDTLESGTVADVMQKGYRLGDRVIRHAMVTVVK